MNIKTFVFLSAAMLTVLTGLFIAGCSSGTASSNSGTGNSPSNTTASNAAASNVAVKTASTKGIAPDKACSVFEQAGLKAEYEYDEKYDSWSCFATRRIGPTGKTRGLNYFASGGKDNVDHLELSMSEVLDDSDLNMLPKASAATHEKERASLLDAIIAGGDDLANLTTGKGLTEEAKTSIKGMKAGEWTAGDVKIEFEIDDKPGMGVDINLHFRY